MYKYFLVPTILMFRKFKEEIQRIPFKFIFVTSFILFSYIGYLIYGPSSEIKNITIIRLILQIFIIIITLQRKMEKRHDVFLKISTLNIVEYKLHKYIVNIQYKLFFLLFLLLILFPVYKTYRIENYFSSKDDNPDEDYQINQAKIAIATGGLFGKAPGKSTQRNMLPQSNSDFIFAIIIEEYGLLFGAVPIILAYMILLFRGIAIAKKCETAFPAFLVMGLTLMIVVQALINMLVATGLLPVTGQTLPMISWGRTSVLVMSFSIGAILSVSRVVYARIRNEELTEEEKFEEGDEKIYEPAKK